MAWSGILAVAAILAVVAGAAKVARPGVVVGALRGIGVPGVSAPAVRFGAALEAAIGVVAVGWAWTPAVAALAASYVGFAVFVLVARTSSTIASCGCFGETDAPPSWRHAVVDLAFAAGCAGAWAASTPGVVTVLRHQPLAGVPYGAVVLLSVWLAYIVLGGPQVEALRSARRTPETS